MNILENLQRIIDQSDASERRTTAAAVAGVFLLTAFCVFDSSPRLAKYVPGDALVNRVMSFESVSDTADINQDQSDGTDQSGQDDTTGAVDTSDDDDSATGNPEPSDSVTPQSGSDADQDDSGDAQPADQNDNGIDTTAEPYNGNSDGSNQAPSTDGAPPSPTGPIDTTAPPSYDPTQPGTQTGTGYPQPQSNGSVGAFNGNGVPGTPTTPYQPNPIGQ